MEAGGGQVKNKQLSVQPVLFQKLTGNHLLILHNTHQLHSYKSVVGKKQISPIFLL